MRLSYEQEKRLVSSFLVSCDVPERDSALISDVITHSDFTGVYSHGLSRFTLYLQQFKSGALNPHPDIRIIRENEAAVSFDCDNCSGIVGVNAVYDEVLKRARKYGVASGTGKHAANINCGSYYGWRMAQDNVLGIVMSNTYPAMAPYGGADRLIGTNPIIMGCPAGDEYPIVLDISTSNVAMGKVVAYRREGKAIPLGWANDRDGIPTTDANAAYCAVPIGAYKGYGLAVFVDIFGAILGDALFGDEIEYTNGQSPENTGFNVILLDIEKFLPLERFKARADEYVRMMKHSRRASGVDEIFLPGEIEYRRKKETMLTGMEFSDALCEELTERGRMLGMLGPDQTVQDFAAAF